MDGWISLHRKITNHAVFSDPAVLRLFLMCLLKATYVPRSVAIGSQKVDLSPGQFVTGRDALADEYNTGLKTRSEKVDARTVWRWIKRLETWGCLSCNSSNKFTVITVVNWAEYQGTHSESVQQNDQQNVQQVSSTCPTGVQHVSTNNKEINKESNKETNHDAVDTEVLFQEIAIEEFERDVEAKMQSSMGNYNYRLVGKDYHALMQIIGEQVPQAFILRGIDEAFEAYRPKHSRDHISTFRYCATKILDRWTGEQSKRESEPGGAGRATHRGTNTESHGADEKSVESYMRRKLQSQSEDDELLRLP